MENELRLQINNYDSYQAQPQCLDNLHPYVSQVPVIRIYGALVFYRNSIKYGFNTLLHVHNVYPYVYVSCDYEYIKDKSETEHLNYVTDYLERFMADSFKTKKPAGDEDDDPIPNETPGKRRFIASISLCKGVPIYGYHVGYRLYYKISFLSPLYKSRFSNMFHDKRVDLSGFSKSKLKFEIFEAHIPYLSQFLTDFNLFSCNWINFKSCYFRRPILQHTTMLDLKHLSVLKDYLTSVIDNTVILSERVGKTLLEMDIKSSFILNRSALSETTTNLDMSLFGSDSTCTGVSSVELIAKELTYQARAKDVNFSFRDDVMSTNSHDVTPKFANQPELDSLLDYAIKLTLNIRIPEVDKYSANIFSRYNQMLAKYPTLFSVVDIEKLKYPLNVLMSDLYTYNDVNELFIGVDDSSQKSASFTLRLAETSNVSIELNPEVQSELPPAISLSSDSELDSSEKHDEKPAEDSSEDIEEIDNTFNDSQILFEMTQTQHVPNKQMLNDAHSLSKASILKDLDDSGIVKINYDDPFNDNVEDVLAKPLIFSNRKIKVPLKTPESIPYLLVNSMELSNSLKAKVGSKSMGLQDWEYTKRPPLKRLIIESYEQEQQERVKRLKYKTQLEMPISRSNHFRFSQKELIERRPDDFVQLSTLIMEVHVNKFSAKLPDPKQDEISAIFYKFIDVNAMFAESNKIGVFINKQSFRNWNESKLNEVKKTVSNIIVFDNELSMVNQLIEMVEYFDPDILSGFEINAMSWGYLIERFQKKLNISILPMLSRCKIKNTGKLGDRWGYTHTSNFRVVGRFTFNLWRVLRKEVTLNNYTFENCCYHICHYAYPKIDNHDLSTFLNGSFDQVTYGIFHYLNKLNIMETFIDSLDLIDKNVELSRLVGVDFNSNFARGSQFKVESIFTRLCKSENYLLNSPSKEQVHRMKALEQIPLIMEPNSGFYKSPLLVLDFQSLYPSIVIAYNLCYSTFVCRLHGFKAGRNPIGYLRNMDLPPMILDLLHKNNALHVTPNGMVFVKSKVRRSMLANMLQEILTLRINIKTFLNFFKQDGSLLKRVFNSRQLALKLIANVTYGYTSATYSGRMPNSDIADAIVATGREILTQSIDLIESSGLGCKVVYGDTDSLFVYLPGKSKDEAFEIGESLAKTISQSFPDPIKLKFEKVYHPSVLLSKKRYVGNCYEYKDQKEPTFDAKGIETIRRDGIPAQQKIVEKALKILFATSNLSKVKKYVVEEFTKVLHNKVIIKDFCFAKEVRFGTYKSEMHLPPGAIVAQKMVDQDERSEPQYRERVPYVVYKDPNKIRLKDRCVSPEEFIQSLNTSKPMQLDYEYYITKVLIPPLERIFNLMGVDIQDWYKKMPLPRNQIVEPDGIVNFGIVQKKACLNCGQRTRNDICSDCMDNIPELILNKNSELKEIQLKLSGLQRTCESCLSTESSTFNSHKFYRRCVNKDCDNYFNVIKATREMESVSQTRSQMYKILDQSEN